MGTPRPWARAVQVHRSKPTLKPYYGESVLEAAVLRVGDDGAERRRGTVMAAM